MPSLKHALLAMMMTNVRAWYQMYDFAPPRYELSWYQMYDKIAAAHAEVRARKVTCRMIASITSTHHHLLATQTAPSPYWSATPDAYDLKIRLPDLEPGTVEAQLSSDGKKIEVKGERKIESCSCKPTTVREIALPYRPRAEDITVTIHVCYSIEKHFSQQVQQRAGSNSGRGPDAAVEEHLPSIVCEEEFCEQLSYVACRTNTYRKGVPVERSAPWCIDACPPPRNRTHYGKGSRGDMTR